jgi:hypothetical protein
MPWTLRFVAAATKVDPDFREWALAEARELNAQLRDG